MHKLQHGLPVLLMILLSKPASAVTVNATNDWAACELQGTITNAGDYYSSTLESDGIILNCNHAYLSIDGVDTSTTAWTVSSRLTNNVTGMTVELIRTGNGTGDSSLIGGGSYTPLTTAFQNIFTGQGNVSSIPLNFRINNFDVTDGYGNHNFQIEYQIITN